MGLVGRLALIECATALLAIGSAHGASFTILGQFTAEGVSSDGSVVVGSGTAIRWTAADGPVAIGPASSLAMDVSPDGSVIVGGAQGSSTWDVVQWTETGGMKGLGRLPGQPESVSQLISALGVSADGSAITGFVNTASSEEAFYWTSTAGLMGLGDLPGGATSSRATDISADGKVVVGGSFSSNGQEAFRWTADTGMIALGDLPGIGFASAAQGISADGLTIVGFGRATPGFQAFRWTEVEGMVGLGELPGGAYGSVARAASGDGSVIVGAADNIETAFIWRAATGMRPLQAVLETDYGLDLQGLILQDATAISPDGLHIVGYASEPESGERFSWLASLPEPRSGHLVGVLIAFLLWTRSRPWRPS